MDLKELAIVCVVSTLLLIVSMAFAFTQGRLVGYSEGSVHNYAEQLQKNADDYNSLHNQYNELKDLCLAGFGWPTLNNSVQIHSPKNTTYSAMCPQGGKQKQVECERTPEMIAQGTESLAYCYECTEDKTPEIPSVIYPKNGTVCIFTDTGAELRPNAECNGTWIRYDETNCWDCEANE